MKVKTFLGINTNTDVSYCIMYNIEHYVDIRNQGSFGYKDCIDCYEVKEIDDKILDSEVVSFYFEGNVLFIGTSYKD